MSSHVAIIGAGLGGLSAAIYLRCSGFDVTIYEKNPTVGGRANRIEENGFRFDTGPSLVNYPWVFEQLFADSGASLGDYVELVQLDPSVIFYWRDGSQLALSPDVESMVDTLAQFEPAAHVCYTLWLRDTGRRFRFVFDHLVTKNANTVLEWIAPVPKRDLLRLGIFRSLDRELGRYFRSERVRAALGSYAMYLGGSPYQLPGTFSILPYGELYYGLWYPKGGIYALVEAIRQRAEEVGVNIVTNAPVKQILTDASRVVGIELQGGIRINSDIVVANVDVPTAMSLVDSFRHRRRRWPMTPGVITFYWGISTSLDVPFHHAIFLPDKPAIAYRQLRTHVPDDLPFYVCIPSRSDPSVAPTGSSAVFVLVPSPTITGAGTAFAWDAAVVDARRRVLQRLAHHGVYIEDDVITVEHVWTPREWHRRFGLYDGSAFGLSHTLANIGPLRPSNRDKQYAGLYYVGASTTPGTGMPMVVLSGRMTAERILHDTRR